MTEPTKGESAKQEGTTPKKGKAVAETVDLGGGLSPEGVPYQAPSAPREESEREGEPYEYGRPSGGAGLAEPDPG